MTPRTERRIGWRAKAAMLAPSLVVAVATAELLASVLHHGAYPFLNIFVPDARYGVRLRAHARTRTRSRLGRVTPVATNGAGFRGPEWTPARGPRPVADRVLLLGDSQAFGFGVAWDETLAPRLARALGGAVFNAAVPTWGPTEYVRVVDDLVPVYRPRYVVFVANAANDWFETVVDNTRRTTARDGWAARRTDPESTSASSAAPAWFPGRDFVMGRSHLALAWREIFARTAAAPALERPRADMAARLLRELPRIGQPRAGYRSRVTPHALAAARACRAWGCTVVAVALPLDVQVHPGEWAKYHADARDLAATERLLTDFVADARDAGLPAVDLLPALRAASPGAFLPDDYHLSPAGHRVAAAAVAAAIRADAHRPEPPR
jgi:hypothetical protein